MNSIFYVKDGQVIEEPDRHYFACALMSGPATLMVAAPRHHIRENDDGDWEIWTWGQGIPERVDSFGPYKTEPEAQEILTSLYLEEVRGRSYAPPFFDTREEAERYLAAPKAYTHCTVDVQAAL